MSVAECRRQVSSKEFVQWEAYFETVPQPHHYWAQLTCEVARGHVKEPQKLELNHFILKAYSKKAEKPKPNSKKVWLKAFGFDKSGKLVKTPKPKTPPNSHS